MLDLTGKQFGRLTVTSFSHLKNSRQFWDCKCSCGNSKIIRSDALLGGTTKSCNCLGHENSIKSRFKHGMRNDPFYKLWASMKYRCENPATTNYENYGGRGIYVCKRWHDFLNFKEDMYNSYRDHCQKFGRNNTSIERNDTNKNYYPENCRWATRLEQNSNTRRNVFIEFNGEKLTISQWSRKLGVNRTTIYRRVFKAKWPLEKALTN